MRKALRDASSIRVVNRAGKAGKAGNAGKTPIFGKGAGKAGKRYLFFGQRAGKAGLLFSVIFYVYQLLLFTTTFVIFTF